MDTANVRLHLLGESGRVIGVFARVNLAAALEDRDFPASTRQAGRRNPTAIPGADHRNLVARLELRRIIGEPFHDP